MCLDIDTILGNGIMRFKTILLMIISYYGINYVDLLTELYQSKRELHDYRI